VAVSKGFTDIVSLPDALQPLASVTVTVKVVFVVGLTVMVGDVAPVDQVYPLYVSVVDKIEVLLMQIGFLVAFIVGAGIGLPTVTVLLAEFLHPLPSVTVTV
jgi:hypothetical protein